MQLSRMKGGLRLKAGFMFSCLWFACGALNAHALNKNQAPDLNSIRVLDLDTAARIALAGSPTLAAARERILQAKARISQAGASFWPRLDLSVSASQVNLSDSAYATQHSQARFFDSSAEVTDPEDYYRAGISFSWRMFDGFARRLNHKAAGYGLEQHELSNMDTKRTLLYATAQAFYTARLALENLSIAEADQRYNQQRLAEAKARHRVGTGSLSDVLNFRLRANAAGAEQVSAAHEYEAAVHSLAAVLGFSGATLPPHIRLAPLQKETDQEMYTPDPEPLIAYAHSHRPDVLRSEITLKQMENGIKAAKAGYYPSVDFTMTVDGSRTGDAGFEEEDFGSTLGLSLKYNLFSGGLTRAKIREAGKQWKEASHALTDAKLTVSAKVRSSLAKLKSAQKQVILQRANAKLVQRHRDLVEKEYLAGKGSLVRLNEAQRDLITTKIRLSLSLVSLRMAWFSLETETGRILEKYPG